MNNIHDYLQELKTALKSSDAATVQDALSDAEEYLSNAVEAMREKSSDVDEISALQMAIAQYGSPQETAAAYVEVEQRLSPPLRNPNSFKSRSFLAKFFGIFSDPLAWGSILYILISFITGIMYFTWSVTGLSLSVSFLVFIFGLIFLLFFLYSLRGIALLEGRIVDALLGMRMPRRPLFKPRGLSWTQQLKLLIKDKHTWFLLLYTLLQLPLSLLYFCVFITLLALSLTGFAIPVIQYVFHLPVINMDMQRIFLPVWSMPLIILAGILLLTGTFYLAKGIGFLQARWAKLMLVVE